MSANPTIPVAAKSPIRLHQTGHDVYGQRQHRRIEKNEIAPCSVVSRRIVLLVIWTSDTWAVIATTSE